MIRTLLIAGTFCLTLAAQAQAQAGEGTTTIELDRGAAVTLGTGGGAESFERRAALPVVVGSRRRTEWRLGHRGFLMLRGRGSVRLTALELRAGRRVTLVARVRGRRRTVFTADGRARRDSRTGRILLRDAPLRLAPALAQRVGGSGRIGRLNVDARLGAGGSSSVQLPVRPRGAVDLVAGSISWHLRDSLVQYLNAGEGIRVSDGARAGRPTTRPGSDQQLVYDVELPLRAGWHDPASGLTVLELRGAVGFRYRAHGIDFAVRDPVIELEGGRPSRATFRFTGEAGDAFDGSRAPLVDLQPDRAAARTTEDGTTTITDIPGLVPAAKTILSGFYQPGDPFGSMTVRYIVKR